MTVRRNVLFGAAVWGWGLLSPITNEKTMAVTFVDGFPGIQSRWLRQPWRENMIHSSDSNSERRIRIQPCWPLQTVTHPSSHSASKNSEGAAFVENISIEYCPGCRWMTKAFWMATELLQNFPEELTKVTIIPSEPGTFNITARVVRSEAKDTTKGEEKESEITLSAIATTPVVPRPKGVQLWDRKTDGGFPPIDLVEFRKRFEACLTEHEVGSVDAAVADDGYSSPLIEEETSASSPFAYSHVVIKYCPSSGYLLRAAYYGQELLTTFCEGELKAISLKPVQENTPIGGFSVELLNDLCLQTESPPSIVLWDNSELGRFPEVKELKRLVRDKVIPQKDLGHSEDQVNNNINGEEESLKMATADNMEKESLDNVGDCIPCNDAATSDIENDNTNEGEEGEDGDNETFMVMDDDDSEKARRYFGVM